MNTNDNNQIKKFFFDQSENVVGILGQGYLTSLLQGRLSKSVFIALTKRIYQRGKVYEKNPFGGIVSVKGHKGVDIKDITGLSFWETNPWFTRVVSFLGILLIIIGIGFMKIGLVFWGILHFVFFLLLYF